MPNFSLEARLWFRAESYVHVQVDEREAESALVPYSMWLGPGWPHLPGVVKRNKASVFAILPYLPSAIFGDAPKALNS